MRKIGIIAALSGELKPLVKGWQQSGSLFTGQIGDNTCIAVAGGVGSEAATKACELVLAEGKLDALISYGWAGALSCGIKPPSASAIREVIDSRTKERFVTDSPEGQRLVTHDHVVPPGEKRQLATEYQAALVDMEAAAVARIAAARNIPFYCFKGVSDGSNDNLPDFNRFMGKDGQFRMPLFVAYALFHPVYWPALHRLDSQSKAAAVNLATLATESLGRRL